MKERAGPLTHLRTKMLLFHDDFQRVAQGVGAGTGSWRRGACKPLLERKGKDPRKQLGEGVVAHASSPPHVVLGQHNMHSLCTLAPSTIGALPTCCA